MGTALEGDVFLSGGSSKRKLPIFLFMFMGWFGIHGIFLILYNTNEIVNMYEDFDLYLDRYSEIGIYFAKSR